MRKTLLSSALTGTAGALALAVVLGAGPAFAGNDADAGDDQIAVQDVLNGNGNNRDNDNSVSVDDSLNNNDLNSNNNNLSLDAELENIGNSYSATDNSTSVDAELDNVANDYSDRSLNAELDNIGNDYSDRSTSIEDVAVLVSTQTLVGAAAKSVGGLFVRTDDIETGAVDFDDAYKMAAGSITSSTNTGLSSNAQAATAILANGDFHID